jgi:sigma-B regulation protein RsbU (phosphoserine phosphatase)
MALQERRKLPRASATPAFIAAIESDASALDRAIAADVLLRHIFVPPAQTVPGLQYAAIYRFAEKHSGGDIIDVYRCARNVHFSLTDISGKGVGAALHAGLVKYGIRAYATEEHAPRDLLRNLNRFYNENDAFEQSDSFASVFFARYCRPDRTLSYASAGHEGLVFFSPGGDVTVLEPTGPVVGVLADDPHLYADHSLHVESGSVLVAVSDGITEARSGGVLFEMNRLIAVASQYRTHSVEDLACSIARASAAFANQRVIDDMAVLAVRFD